MELPVGEYDESKYFLSPTFKFEQVICFSFFFFLFSLLISINCYNCIAFFSEGCHIVHWNMSSILFHVPNLVIESVRSRLLRKAASFCLTYVVMICI